MSHAVVFSGQGAQHPAMLPWLADDATLRAMCVQLGVADWRAALRDPDWAGANLNAQLVLTGVALAAWQQLAGALPAPRAVAGYSVGELAACSAAGMVDAATALDLARRRAEAMDRAAARAPGALMGVTGPAAAELERVCAAHGLDVAIRTGSHSGVVAGTLPALAAAQAQWTAAGARCTRLPVAVRSHTPAMRSAADAYAQVLAGTALSAPRLALVCNATGARCAGLGEARDALAAQIATTVRWDDCMQALHERRPRCVLEIGPGQALARLWNEQHPDIPARACDDFRSRDAVVEWVRSAR